MSSSAVVGMLTRLRQRQQEQRDLCIRQLENSRAARGPDAQPSPEDQAALRELRESTAGWRSTSPRPRAWATSPPSTPAWRRPQQ